ncbi:MAG: hypothetical protein LUO94_06615 [Methylococcaceae bacterium]|nr:hypothetical protein [Methylococcaceae bacterium]
MGEQHKKDGTYQVQTGVSNTASAFKTVEKLWQGRERLGQLSSRPFG